MDLSKILAELKNEKILLEESILALQRVGMGRSGKRRGRPPKWMTEAREPEVPKKRGRPRKAS